MVMRMCSSSGDLCAGSSGTLFKCRRCIPNGATLREHAEPMHLRSLSTCKRYILNAALMLRTFERKRYTLKVAFWLTCACSLAAIASAPHGRSTPPRLAQSPRVTVVILVSSPRAFSARNRCFRSPRATVAFEVFHLPPPWRAGRRALGQSALASRQVPHCRN
jgi:hypothetical protein